MLHICGKSNFNIPDVECDGSLHFEGVADTTINQGVGIDLAEGISAYDSDGNEVEFTYKPEEIEKCDVGEHTVTYTAQGKNAGDMIPTVCGTDRLHLIDCGIDTVKATRIITITQAGNPVIVGIDPTLLPSGSTVDLLSGVSATDDNGNELDVTWYGEKDSLAEGDITTFETDLAPNLLKKAEVRLDPVQDLHGYDRPWVGGAGKNLFDVSSYADLYDHYDGSSVGYRYRAIPLEPNTQYTVSKRGGAQATPIILVNNVSQVNSSGYFDCRVDGSVSTTFTTDANGNLYIGVAPSGTTAEATSNRLYAIELQIEKGSTATTYAPYENICPIYGHDDVEVWHVGKNLWGGLRMADDIVTAINNPTYSNKGEDSIGKYVSIVASYAVTKTLFDNFKSNTMYTFIFPYSKNNANGISNMQINYTDGSYQYISTNATTIAGQKYVTVTQSIANRSIKDITGVYGSGTAYLYYEECGIFEGVVTVDDFEPYTEQTYNQEIEVTYTPTSTNNIPYNFKAVGDIYGDRLMESIVGGTVAWNQLITDANKSRTITPSGSTAYSYTSVTGSHTIGHVYFVSMKAKYTGNKTDTVYNYFQVGNASGDGRATLPKLTPNVVKTQEAIVKSTASSTSVVIGASTGDASNPMLTTDVWNFTDLMFVDLTQMFGSTIANYIFSLEQANAGDGVAYFRKMFPNTYYPYDSGTLKSVTATSHDTVGFNQWDEEWEVGAINTANGDNTNLSTTIRSKNYIPTLPNTVYYRRSPVNLLPFYYDSDKAYIGYGTWGTGQFTTPTNCYYVRFYTYTTYGNTYNNDICINISSDRNGQYEAYEKHTYPLDSTLTLRGIPKLSDGNVYYDGDEYASDGTVTRRYGIVDLGTLTWSKSATGLFRTPLALADGSGSTAGAKDKSRLLGYTEIGATPISGPDGANPSPNMVYAISSGGVPTLFVNNTSYTDPTAFKTAMSGVYLVYELATPTTESAMPFANPQRVSKYGTEAYEGSEIPVGHNTTYLTRDIYGGTLDLVSGVLTVTKKLTTITVFSGTFGQVTNGYCVYKSLSNRINSRDSISNYFVQSSRGVDSMPLGSFQGASGVPETWAFILPNTITSLAEANAWLESLSEPLVVTENLDTPQTYQLNRHQIETLVGENNMWDDGYMKVVFTETIQNNPVTFDVDGTYAITYEAEDECGNETRQTRLIFIRNENVYFLGLDHVTNTLGESFDLTENVHAYDGQGNELEFTVTPEYNAFALGNRTYTYTADGYSEGRVITIVPPTTPIQTEDDEDIEAEDGVVLETDALTPIPLTYASNKWSATIPINPLHTYTFRLQGLKAFAYIRVNVTGEGGDVATYDGIGTTDWNLTWTPSEHVESGQSWENARQATIEISQTDEPTAYVIVQ